jgi:hypothetical protein
MGPPTVTLATAPGAELPAQGAPLVTGLLASARFADYQIPRIETPGDRRRRAVDGRAGPRAHALAPCPPAPPAAERAWRGAGPAPVADVGGRVEGRGAAPAPPSALP